MEPALAPHPTSEEQWQALVMGVLKGGSVDGLVKETLDGVAIRPLYPKADHPATWPMPAAKPWGIAQRVDHPDPLEANRLALADLEGGADTLVVVLYRAPSAHGFGLDLRGPDNLEAVLAGIDLGAITLRGEPGAEGLRFAQAVMTLAERRGEDLGGWRLALGLDPIGIYAGTGRMEAGWSEISRRMAATFQALRTRGFTGRAFAADGRPYHAAGASEAQELGAVAATAVAMLRALEAHDVGLEDARDTLDFTLTADADLFLTVSKLRALRLLWSQVETACGLAPKPILLHVETAWRSMTRRDPQTNLLRTTLAAFGAVVGGADSVAVLPHTIALGLPDDLPRRIARNIHHVLADEANLWRVADPVAGAGGFEAWTQDLAAEAWRVFQQIEREGGIVASLSAGALQGRIGAMQARRAALVASGKVPIVGVTAFRDATDVPSGPARFAEATAVDQDAANGFSCTPLTPMRDSAPFEEVGVT